RRRGFGARQAARRRRLRCGFLITSLLSAEWTRSGRVDLARFWWRRARRLVPALLLVLLAAAVYSLLAAQPEQRATLRGDGLSTLD
ncbi:MAG: hypothetical protein ACXV3F_16160, partial [Frankiaceae bacterium]